MISLKILKIKGSPYYAIYGHSLGSLLSYELYYKIKQIGIKKPKHIFFSEYRAPSILRQREKIYTLPDYDFMKKVMVLGRTPAELIKNQELLEIFTPIIRNDFKILENYKYKERENKIECNISVLNGKQDAIKLEEILAWINHVSKEFKVYNFDGNHIDRGIYYRM